LTISSFTSPTLILSHITVILTLKAWAICGRGRRTQWTLAGIFCVVWIIAGIFLGLSLSGEKAIVVPELKNQCLLEGQNSLIVASFVLFLMYDGSACCVFDFFLRVILMYAG
jgi:hypothetical protein